MGSDQGRARLIFPLPNWLGEACLALGLGPTPSEAPPGCTDPGHIGERGEQERQAGGALQDQRSRRGVEGICPTHLGPGSLLGSQASPLPSKAPSRPPSKTRDMPGPLLLH